MTDPDPGGPKTSGSTTVLIRIQTGVTLMILAPEPLFEDRWWTKIVTTYGFGTWRVGSISNQFLFADLEDISLSLSEFTLADI
jgi:hypothetical protein